MKPIIVTGVDFSGTSMVAGLLQAAGIDMGDVDSEEEVSESNSPILYRTFEDKELRSWLAPLAQWLYRSLPTIQEGWLHSLYQTFMSYYVLREEMADGKPWGVKNNGLLFLAMHPGFDEIPAQWITTYRLLEDSMESCFNKLGPKPHYAAMLGIEYLAWQHLMEHNCAWEFAFDDLLYSSEEVMDLCRKVGVSEEKYPELLAMINPHTKGVIHAVDRIVSCQT